jgi:hypothetical protein
MWRALHREKSDGASGEQGVCLVNHSTFISVGGPSFEADLFSVIALSSG